MLKNIHDGREMPEGGTEDIARSTYFAAIVQYDAKLDTDVKMRKRVMREASLPRKRVHMRLAPEEESARLTGCERNAVTPVGFRVQMPLICSDHIMQLDPPYLWMGGGEPDLKLRLPLHELKRALRPFVWDITSS